VWMRRLVFVALASGVASCGARTGPSVLDAAASSTDAADATTDGGHPLPCGTRTCGIGEVCIRGRCAGCCGLPPECVPIPIGCPDGALACGCLAQDPCSCSTCESVTVEHGIVCGDCRCTCAAPWSPVATPSGPTRIADLHPGDLVYSVDHGEVTIVPIAQVNRQAVAHHAMARVTLLSGDVIELSGGHPTADGRPFDTLGPDDQLGDAVILAVETVPYEEPFTYDILPASDTGTYFVAGAWVGSTLHVSETP
jgi:hypothetical protein